MKIDSIVNICANLATVIIAACAILGIQQTAKSLREAADINRTAMQYYATQNALMRPIFRIEQTRSSDFTAFSKEGWTFPFGPEDICKDISVYNDGAWVKNVEVTIETYLMTCYYALTTNNMFQGTAMYVPVKEFYQFSQNGKVRGLIATGKSSRFQKKLMTQIRDVHSGTDGKHLAICMPFNVYTIKYEDALGNQHKELYSNDIEISDKEKELEHNLLYSKELFQGRIFTYDDFDIGMIVKEYGQRATELGKRYAEKGFIREVYQDSRPIITNE